MTDKLVFETDIFRDECIKICKDNIEPIINNSIKELEKRMIDETKNNIQKKIGCQDMYDYSEFEEIKIFKGFRDDVKFNELIKYPKNFWSNEQYFTDKVKLFLNNFKPTEKIVVEYFINYSINNTIYKRTLYITTYGRVLFVGLRISLEDNKLCLLEKGVEVYAFNFWIPTPYLLIFKSMEKLFSKVKDLNEETKDWIQIIDAIDKLKNELFSTKIIPLYAKEIAEENEKLKKEYKKFEEEKIEFEKEKKDLEENIKCMMGKIKPYEDLEIERKKLEKEKELLILVRQKLKKESNEFKIEKERIEKIKNDFEEEKKNDEICKLDIDKILYE